MANKNETKTALVTRAQQLGAGVAKHLGGVTQVTLTGGSYMPADLTTKLQQVVSIQADVDAAKGSVKGKLATQAAALASLRPLMGELVAYVKLTYGSQPAILADFGLSPKARAVLTIEQKAAAAAKRAATRAARGTKGSVQKLAVKGDVTGVTITPTTAAHPVAPVATGSPTVGGTTPAPTATPAPHTGTT